MVAGGLLGQRNADGGRGHGKARDRLLQHSDLLCLRQMRHHPAAVDIADKAGKHGGNGGKRRTMRARAGYGRKAEDGRKLLESAHCLKADIVFSDRCRRGKPRLSAVAKMRVGHTPPSFHKYHNPIVTQSRPRVKGRRQIFSQFFKKQKEI